MRRSGLVTIAAAGLAAGCGGNRSEREARPEPAPAAAEPGDPAPRDEAPAAAPPPPVFPEGTRSLRLRRSIVVRLEPGTSAKQIGTVAQDTRVAWTRTAAGEGCKQPWVEIVPRGWVCGEYLEPQPKPPSGVELPRLERGEVVPGRYGQITEKGAQTFTLPPPPKQAARGKAPAKGKDGKAAPPPPPPPPQALVPGRPLLGAVKVRKYGELTQGGKAYWKVDKNEYVLAKSVRELKPSTYQGIRLGDDTGITLPVAFVWPRAGKTAWTRGRPRAGTVRQVAQREALPILEAHEVDGKVVAYRVGEAEWIDAADVRVAAAAPPPPLIGPDERWIDVDADLQLLVAYEGTMPVYATLVSTGKRDHATDPGIWRMWHKVSETDMRGLGEDPYSVATVPWTQFFDPKRGYALHAAYWHDGWGIPKSRGCINLSPPDARWLYFWTDPVAPPGWTMTAGVLEAPGSIVRVRSAAAPEPPLKGYAIKVQEAREEAARRGRRP